MRKISKKHIINEQIRYSEVRLIGSDGSQLGIVTINEARSKAEEQELDLVLISPNSKPPVCKIINYGKFLYEITKKEKEAKKSHRGGVLKEIKITPKIDKHDLDVRIKHIDEFIKKGHKVKVTVTFRGREITHMDIGRKLLDQMVLGLEGVAKMEQAPHLEGKNLHIILSQK